MKILDNAWTNASNVAVQVVEPLEGNLNDRVLQIVHYEGNQANVVAEARMSQSSWVKLFPVFGGGAYDAHLTEVRQQVKDTCPSIPSVEDSPFTQLKEAVEDIRDTARTSLKPDVYATDEAWMRSQLGDIAGQSDRLLKALR